MGRDAVLAPRRGDSAMTETSSLRFAAFVASRQLIMKIAVAAITIGALAIADHADAQTLGYAPIPGAQSNLPSRGATYEQDALTPEHLRKAVVAYDTREAAGTIVIDTSNTYLYYVLGQGRAIRYGVGVGREGFTWSGVQTISRKAEWPDWIPPADMIARQPYLPRFVGGGLGNPLGARAMYLGSSVYRIHGTNDPSTIGNFVSSGCIRMTNEDVIDLFGKVDVGTKVVVLPKASQRALDAYAAMPNSAFSGASPPRREISVTVTRQLPARTGVISGLY
jgi:lipoprotein-anchoring transpeptidase ErfK/SrfK